MEIDNKIYIKKYINKITALSIIFIGIYSILTFPQLSAVGIKVGLTFCSETLIPSLFPFMVISSFIIKSQISLSIGKIIDPFTKLIFKLPGCAGTTLLLGLIGGYPTGARGIKTLLDQKQISKNTACHMAMFTFGAGPAFIINVIGINFLGSSQIGLILFTSHILSSIILGVILSLFYKPSTKINASYQLKESSISSAFVSSCIETTYAIINMCAFVILFSALINILDGANISNFISNILYYFKIPKAICDSFTSVFLEVTSGSFNCIKSRVPLEFLSFALGWGGVCVHFQVYSALEDINFSKIKFMLIRVFHGVFSFFLTSIFLSIFLKTTTISCISHFEPYKIGTNAFSKSLTLIFLCLGFICSLTPREINIKK